MSGPVFLDVGRVAFMLRLRRMAGRASYGLFDRLGGELSSLPPLL